MDDLKREQLVADIRNFNELAWAMESRLDLLDEVLDITPESPLRKAAWDLIGGYINALDRAWNIGGWLEWWWSEVRLGESPSSASLKGEPMRPIRNIDDLVGIVLDDLCSTEASE
ncbi:hypothetical protein [Stenotrophomonas sp.]|uniref:hypothetical protein n=1 Tax=Stenotrophomonas sp. TaxID=69392 RepID=UPI0028B02704|nr:hypothetical protein [Stenotrophomonas sp.]